MDIQRVYEKVLVQFDPEEKIAYEYYQMTGEELNYFQASYLNSVKKDPGAPTDFTLLQSPQVLEREAELRAMVTATEEPWRLDEQQFIASHFNVELNYVQRYIWVPPHQHDFYEVVCTLRGSCLHTVEQQAAAMKTGDVVIIPPGISHQEHGAPDCIAVNIKIRKSTFDRVFISLLGSGTPLADYFAETLYSGNYRNSLTFHCGEDPFLFELLLYMYAQQVDAKPHANDVIDGLITTFFSFLIQNYEDTMELSSAETAANERMARIENYLNQNYAVATLSGVAAHFYLSPPYLSTIIKQQTGHSFSETLRKIRMKHARDLLLHTRMKVDDICEAVGYRDSTQFIRTFKAFYGATPKQYQKQAGARHNPA